MTNEQMRANVIAFLAHFDRYAANAVLSEADQINVLTCAALEGLARRIGKPGVVEHLRNVADVAEREALEEAGLANKRRIQ